MNEEILKDIYGKFDFLYAEMDAHARRISELRKSVQDVKTPHSYQALLDIIARRDTKIALLESRIRNLAEMVERKQGEIDKLKHDMAHLVSESIKKSLSSL
jgi:predicted  nucleic acid-binding Zn-ribbon protein